MDEDPPEAVPLDGLAAPPVENTPSAASRVPVTIITGFLGAGKTTLVNHILSQPHGYKVAVILNDFGDNLGIEKAMVQDTSSQAFSDTDDVTGSARGQVFSKGSAETNTNPGESKGRGAVEPIVEEWVEVGNGCICCSVKHSFVLALEQLLERRDRFDYILLETTGLANPGPVISMLWTDDELESPLRLDSVVTVVDGRNILEQLTRDSSSNGCNLAQLQIAYADTVILNKLDLIASDPAMAEKIEEQIMTINSSARVIRTERCSVDVRTILNSHLFDIKEQALALLEEPGKALSAPMLGITTVHFSSKGDVDLSKVELSGLGSNS